MASPAARALLTVACLTAALCTGVRDSALHGAPTEAPLQRRVNWFVPTGGVRPSVDGLNNSQWAAAHRDAVTGYYYCCACWAVCPHPSDPSDAVACKGKPNGTFVNTGRCPGRTGYSAGGPPWPGGHGIAPGTPRPAGGHWPLLVQETEEVLALGLDIIPTTAVSTQWLLDEHWLQPGSLDSAVALVKREGWAGLGLDNEIKGPADAHDKDVSPDWDPRLPQRFAAFTGNLSAALASHGPGHAPEKLRNERRGVFAGKQLVACVTSTWRGDLGGPDYLRTYADAAPAMRFMDMATYYNSLPNGFTMPQTIQNLSRMLNHKTSQLALGIGAMEQPGHENASALNYRWNSSALHTFVTEAEAAGVPEIDVWRMDIDGAPAGSTAALSDWMIGELAGFLARGDQSSSLEP